MTAFANPDTYRAPLNKNVRLNNLNFSGLLTLKSVTPTLTLAF